MMTGDYGEGVHQLQFDIEDIYKQMDPQYRGKKFLFQGLGVKQFVFPRTTASIKYTRIDRTGASRGEERPQQVSSVHPRVPSQVIFRV